MAPSNCESREGSFMNGEVEAVPLIFCPVSRVFFFLPGLHEVHGWKDGEPSECVCRCWDKIMSMPGITKVRNPQKEGQRVQV